ncbi:MAG: Gfo/Idh/MocA family oxidoreductase [Deltaproteobacteria bacterium]|jgi:predicted dehydrogenase|nr:Gfo/Idh/MocA family oxidoreductase [Deltaproteobacteria bacterium]
MRVIRWGVVGCGEIVRRRVGPALTSVPGCEIAGVARRDLDRLDGCRDKLQAKRGFGDWRDMLRDDAIDAVYIATPVHAHCEQVLAALKHGKHVLCEKPLGMDEGECRKMRAASQQGAVALGVAYYRHYYPAVLRMKAIVASGEIGDVLLVTAVAAETFRPAEDHPRRWILDKSRAGGGSLMDFGCHRIEVLLHLLGKEISAGGVCGRVYGDHDVEDSATVAIQFASGANGLVTATRGGTMERDVVCIQGTRGVVRVDNLNGGWLTVSGENGTRQETLPCHANPHQPLIEAFCNAIRENRPPDVDAETGWRVQRIIDAVYRNRPFTNGESQ